MKKFNLFVILAFLSAFSMSVEAQSNISRKYIKHSMGVWAEAGEWTMLLTEGKVDNTMGIAGVVGGTYEFQKKHFLLDAGIGVGFGGTKFKLADETIALTNQNDFVDMEKFDYVYTMKNRTEWSQNVSVHIPLLAGFTYRRFYSLAGFNLQANAYTYSTIRGDLETYGHYKQYDDFHNMPEHQFFPEHAVKSNVKAHLNFDVNVHLELGARLGYIKDATGYDVPESPTQFRLAVFAEYGLLDIHTAHTNKPIDVPAVYNHEDMMSEVVYNPFLSTSYATTQVNNLFVGVKFTVLFELPKNAYCISCQQSSPLRQRGGTQIMEEFVF